MNLIIINGACASGKSTIAAKVHERMPLSFLLDVDAQARFISHFREYREERWELVQAVTKAIMTACFEHGRDVVVDKMIYDATVLDAYHAMAVNAGAHVFEFLLWAPKEIVMERAHARGWREGGLLTPEKCEQFWEQIDALKKERPQATVIDTSTMTADAVAQKILNTIVSK